ncbi:bifunctional [glutamate--ammonia ligase]-adenylyl-L-tyrosine phosphorylase/[glutamate--ammonia-ligase] adenylyltransferase [Vannielia litorea]|uniref:bifunctional [glutamate--ammonia ligase]-adenylyl-L-tyrosine phosphorylase/[glutamate--ammonia-ligase] adenylyltransferase n=1 Tax=Vannielia litorea TaxID=1217970 RepID=UPI001C97145A|nr:bifunctional [glutamate--ammonia ligase]-adenylyl-L-tyrosine phosphorylase/[glutamate--ammonia-ligase] adenylyltransferase [Vannielia litorea]MBY6047170.1 bifunctional [glutamate--ammonia ligase]-adenylyl-L-tyrosine phosphorylase/[glutamate--ammonia-ligase] adenylyltransferase [Vannielia litorea]MBY6074584.1 bifunctional [glutamate--ammonia ligase]-adenylyl-L-tyrosine phosphorylase/[glutamate--ammonia-ligase] adenylyltransferase [Vannielia litorea]
MEFESRITRLPIAVDASAADAALDNAGWAGGDVARLLYGMAGSSPYLAGLLAKEARWLEGALAGPVEDVVPAVLAEAAEGDVGVSLRVAKRRLALFTALADLSGVWPLEKVTGALTDLADASVQIAWRRALEQEAARRKSILEPEDVDEELCGIFVLAMGKMGAHELNYSSDIDLIVLFDQDRWPERDFHELRTSLVRATREAAKLLSDNTAEGYVFRTDLRLRPDPSVTPVCLSMEAAERYYESLGRTWERAAHIKARVCAGAFKEGAGYLERLRPFIWRKHLDFAAIQDAHDMRLAIREHKGLHGTALEGRDLKLGRGGIREIEFFTQTRQIIAGGRDPDLRVRGTVEGLARLAEAGWVGAEEAAQLSADYRAHRELEHRIQMVHDQQTHALPKDAAGIERVARLAGEGDTAAFRAQLEERLERVAGLTEGFFAPGRKRTIEEEAPEWGEAAREIMSRWKGYAAFRSTRAGELFARIRPELMAQLGGAAKPEEALSAFDGFLRGLPAGVQIFSLFASNPQLLGLIVDICATAPELAEYLSQNAGVLDAVIGGDFFADWPGVPVLEAQLAEEIARVEDYEGKLDTARRWMKEWHFRIGVHLLRGHASALVAGEQYALLAEAVLRAVFPVVEAEHAARHGAAPGRGAVVLGMGSLGAGWLNAQSDLDLIVIYDAAGVESSEGKRPLTAGAWYARLTKALVTALTALMAEGRLYEVDMRLRPSGNAGPVATSLSAFAAYQREEAWTWEHLALTRARVICGAEALAAEVEAVRCEVLAADKDRTKVLADVAEMRARIFEAKGTGGGLEAKIGPGRMQDIELAAQAAALLGGVPDRRVEAQLVAGALEGDTAQLAETYALMRQVQGCARLLTAGPLETEALGEGARALFARETGIEGLKPLAEQMDEAARMAARVIDTALGGAEQEA